MTIDLRTIHNTYVIEQLISVEVLPSITVAQISTLLNLPQMIDPSPSGTTRIYTGISVNFLHNGGRVNFRPSESPKNRDLRH